MEDLGYVIFHKEANVLAKPWGDAWEYALLSLTLFECTLKFNFLAFFTVPY
jgi:hypothetical protein